MGASTDAILVWGVPLEAYDECPYEELPFAGEGDDGFDDTLARRANARQYPEEGWLDDRRAAEEDSLIDLVYHCSLEFPNYVLGVKSTQQTASRGYPVTFQELPQPTPEEVNELTRFMEEFGIEGTPTWVLCSHWA